MSNLVNTYADPSAVNEPKKSVNHKPVHKKILKHLKHIRDQLDRQQHEIELLKEAAGIVKDAEADGVAETNRQKTAKPMDKKEKSFFQKLGDAVVKAVPQVLKAIATAAVGFFFKEYSTQFRKAKKVLV